MAEPDQAELRAAVEAVEDPMLFAPIGMLGTLAAVAVKGGTIDITVRAPVEEHPGFAVLQERLEKAMTAVAPGHALHLSIAPMSEPEIVDLGERLRALDSEPGATARRVLSISSGKGGVGKSTVTVNLAVALARRGHTVGLLDADVYGFSIPRMLGVAEPPLILGPTVVPALSNGVRCMSMGFFVDEDRAVAWRGPMLHKALEQFVKDVHWGAPEFLLIDTPPGTGDVAMSTAQLLPGAELYVVTTPQPTAERVAQRAGALAKDLRLPVRGIIENMSGFVAPDGTRHELFGSGGGASLAATFGVDLLAAIPFDPAVRAGADVGKPAVVVDDQSAVVAAFDALAERVVGLGPARIYRRELKIT